MEDKFISIVRENGEMVCKNAKIANTMNDRFMGLMFKKDLKEIDGLLIVPCNSIHTFFMRMKIDVVFLDKKLKVVKVIYDLSPWRMTWFYWGAYQVLEMKAGTLNKKIRVGEILRRYV